MTEVCTMRKLLAISLGMALAVGCNQVNKVPVESAPVQNTTTPTQNRQAQETLAPQVYLILPNGCAATGFPKIDQPGSLARYWTSASQPADGPRPHLAKATAENGRDLEQTDAGYIQNGFNFTINIGSTTPGQTGTATGTGSGVLTANPGTTANPVQKVRPELTTALDLGVGMPGSIVDQQATATGRGQTNGTAKTSDNKLTYANIREELQRLASLPTADLLSALGITPSTPEQAAAASAAYRTQIDKMLATPADQLMQQVYPGSAPATQPAVK